MIKLVFRIVCICLLFTNALNAQKDTSTFALGENQTKGMDVNQSIVIGEVLEVDMTQELDFSTLYLQVIDENGKDFYLTATNEDQHFDQLPKVSEHYIGKTIKATYSKSIERDIVEYRPAKIPEGVASKSPSVDEKIIVYTIDGTQEVAFETPEGWMIIFKTPSGVTMSFVADEEVFDGRSASSFDGEAIKISFIEYEKYHLQELEIVD